jgi:6,7-dimethyl-8-ribityllumazine synthase
MANLLEAIDMLGGDDGSDEDEDEDEDEEEEDR